MLLVIMLVTMIVGGYFGVRALNASVARSSIDDIEGQRILAQSREALLAWSITTDENIESLTTVVASPFGVRAFRPGVLPYPDLATSNGNARPSDGFADRGCASRTWAGAGLLRPVTSGMSIAQRTNLRCFGRLPVKTIGLGHLATDTTDDTGRWPWYIVSANLVAINFVCPARLDSAILGSGLPSGVTNCGDVNTPTVPFPWITILDPYGGTLSTRGAAVVILPGPVTARQPGNATQTRSATSLPNTFLDTVDNAVCPGGRCDNGSLNQTPGMTFIQCVKPSTTVGDARFNANYACNDRLVYITIDELMAHAAKRIESEFTACLKEYFDSVNPGKYPWPSQVNNPGTSMTGTLPLTGSFPSIDELGNTTCPLTQSRFAKYWGGWQRAATYRLLAGQGSAQFSFPSLPGRSPVSLP